MLNITRSLKYIINNKKLKNRKIILKIDLKPALTEEKLDERVLRDFRKENNKQFKNSLNKLLPQKLIQPIINKSSINPNKKVNENKSRKIFLLLCNDDRPVTDLCLWPGRCHFHRKVSRYSDSQSNGLLFPPVFSAPIPFSC